MSTPRRSEANQSERRQQKRRRRQGRPGIQAAAGYPPGSQLSWTFTPSASGTGSPTSNTESSSNHFDTPEGSEWTHSRNGYNDSLHTDGRREPDVSTELSYSPSHLSDSGNRDLLYPAPPSDTISHHPCSFAPGHLPTHDSTITSDFLTFDTSMTWRNDMSQSPSTISNSEKSE